jgi:glutathione synthase/RimK-type ligase-like ATP-grasp enzyme
MLDIATLAFLTGNEANRPFALQYQARALELCQVYPMQPPQKVGLRLLVLMAPGDNTSNTPVDCLTENSDIAITLLYVVPGAPFPAALPPHDAVFVAIGESPHNHALLEALARTPPGTKAPVINRPDAIVRTVRDTAARLLADVPGLVMPVTARAHRTLLESIARGAATLREVARNLQFPVIVRPVDSQGGKDLAKVDDVAQLRAYLDRVAVGDFFVAPFVDYRSPDGQFRKLRIALIDGEPFAVHMGVSDHWMIHYINAHMDESAAKRADEQRFFETFADDFAQRHRDALRAVHERLGLDYVTMDCAETRDGQLLVFEVDNAALVHGLDDPAIYPYKVPTMRRVFDAFRAMLDGRIRAPAGSP